jgi:hypothetical protein
VAAEGGAERRHEERALPGAGPACAAGLNMLGSYTQYAYNPSGSQPVSVPTVHDALVAEYGAGAVGYAAVSRPFPSWNRSILTEIDLCHACSCQGEIILRTETAGQGATFDTLDTSGIPAAVELASKSDVAVVVVGDSLHTSSE